MAEHVMKIRHHLYPQGTYKSCGEILKYIKISMKLVQMTDIKNKSQQRDRD